MERTSGIERSRIRRIQYERVASDCSYTSRAENGEVLDDFDVNGIRKERIGRLEYYDDENRSFSQGLVHNKIHGDYCDLNMNRPGYVHFQSEQERFDNFPYHVEGPSSYEMNPHYEYVERTRYKSRDSNMFARVGNLGHDPIELLRKLDELKDQLSRSCDMADKHKERMDSLTLPDPYCLHHNVYVHEGLNSSHVIEKQSFAEDDLEATYLSHIHGCTPSTGRYVSGVGDSYPRRDFPHEFKGYSDTDQPKMLRRPPWHPPSHYMHQPYHDDFPGYYRDINHDLFMLPPHTNFLHQPPCSCVHCSSRNLYIPPKIDPYRFPHEPHNSKFDRHLNPIPHVPQGYSPGYSNLNELHSRQSPTLKSSDLNNESDSLNYHHARKLAVSHRTPVCHPIARGAPLITCCNCFELLKLPKKHVSSTKIQKMKCGACFSVILFELGNKGYPKSVSAQVDPVLNEIDDGSSETINENMRDCHGDSYNADMKGCSNNYDDSKIKSSPIDSKSNSGDSEKQLDALSSTSSTSKDEHSLENVASQIHCTSAAELPPTVVETFPRSDCSQECPDHCSDNNTVSQFDEGNTSNLSEPALDRSTSLQVPINEAVMATNVDMSINVFSNSCVSQDSVEIGREDHQGVIEGGQCFYEGLKKKIFQDFSESNQSSVVDSSKVFVNGHFIPDRDVKKAEKLAGPIQPGEYWYDIIAGFWGVMGHPCLGIIMPNVQEFNYPLPEKCAAGNTGVFVNGRELHQKDLDMLACRGLPILKNRHYFVEISGKVIDEQTGEELDGLGKLAPTVEREKHGFGMRVP